MAKNRLVLYLSDGHQLRRENNLNPNQYQLFSPLSLCPYGDVKSAGIYVPEPTRLRYVPYAKPRKSGLSALFNETQCNCPAITFLASYILLTKCMAKRCPLYAIGTNIILVLTSLPVFMFFTLTSISLATIFSMAFS